MLVVFVRREKNRAPVPFAKQFGKTIEHSFAASLSLSLVYSERQTVTNISLKHYLPEYEKNNNSSTDNV